MALYNVHPLFTICVISESHEIERRELRATTVLDFRKSEKKPKGGGHIFPLWKRLTFKRLILTKNAFRNINVFFKDLSIDTHHGY
ncbi:hypothetical protein SFRURICE_014605, partial [Spodoptera frugiperda]